MAGESRRRAVFGVAALLAAFLTLWASSGGGLESISVAAPRKEASPIPVPRSVDDATELRRRLYRQRLVDDMLVPTTTAQALALRPPSTVPESARYHRTLTSEDVNDALRYERRCPVQVRPPHAPRMHDLRSPNVTEAAYAAAQCLRLGDFLDDCDGRRPPLTDGPSPDPANGEWQLHPKCAWRAGVEPIPFVAGGKRLDPVRWRGTAQAQRPPPVGKLWGCISGKPCTETESCSCWVHSFFKRPHPEHTWDAQIVMPPRVGGRFATWEALPTVDELWTSRDWVKRALLEEAQSFLLIGHSHARALFHTLASVARDVAVGDGDDDASTTLDYLKESEHAVLRVGDRVLAIYVAAASPAADDLTLAKQLVSSLAVDATRLVIVVSRGMWDLENADDGPHHAFLSHAYFLKRLRAAFPAAIVFNYNTHFVHSVHGGCMGALRQVVTRDALACAVNAANADGAAIETFDVFDLTATRRTYFGSTSELAAAAHVGQYLNKLNQTHCNRVLVQVLSAKKPLARLMPLADLSVFTTMINGRYFAPVSDGHHYDAPAMLNIAFAFLVQLRFTPRPAVVDPDFYSPVSLHHSFSRAPLVVPAPAFPNTTCRRCYEGAHVPGGLFCAPWCESLRRRRFVACNVSDALDAARIWVDVEVGGRDTYAWLNNTVRAAATPSSSSSSSPVPPNLGGDVCEGSLTAIALRMGVEALRCEAAPSNDMVRLRQRRGIVDVSLPTHSVSPNVTRGYEWVAATGCAWPTAQRFVFHGPFHRVIVPLVAPGPNPYGDVCWRYSAMPEEHFTDPAPLKEWMRDATPRVVLMGNSHLRFAFASIAGVFADLVGSGKDLVQILPVPQSDFTVLCEREPGVPGHDCGACREALVVYYPTPIPTAADLQAYWEMAASKTAADSTVPARCLIAPSNVTLFVTTSGAWETQNTAPRRPRNEQLLLTVQRRMEAFLTYAMESSWLAKQSRAARVVFQMPPGSHVSDGCLAPERLERLREPLITAISNVNRRQRDHTRRVAVWDMFGVALNRLAPTVNVSRMPLVSAFEFGRTTPQLIGVGDRVHVDMPAHLSSTLALLHSLMKPLELRQLSGDGALTFYQSDARPVVVVLNTSDAVVTRPSFDRYVGSCNGCFERPDFRLWSHTWCAVQRRREAELGCIGRDAVLAIDTRYAATPPRRSDAIVNASVDFLAEMSLATAARAPCN